MENLYVFFLFMWSFLQSTVVPQAKGNSNSKYKKLPASIAICSLTRTQTLNQAQTHKQSQSQAENPIPHTQSNSHKWSICNSVGYFRLTVDKIQIVICSPQLD